MRALSLSIFILFFNNLYSQYDLNLKYQIPKADNSIIYNLHKNQLSFYDLNNIENNNSKKIIRLWNIASCIELIEFDDKIVGKIYFAIKINEDKNEFLRKEVVMNQVQANQINELFKLFNIDKLTEKEEDNFENKNFIKYEVLDSPIFTIETSIQNKYTLISYNGSTIYHENKEGKILNLNEETNKILNLNEEFKSFTSEVRNKCYRYYGVSYSVCNLLTKKEARKLKQKQKKEGKK